ncbi:class IIc cyclic bacteriocin [Gemella cuniculi]|uniref:class IIc cyclic bacteriocin n=1 Tax=Gemella cuniculi TaxID=150240 RepID=UPI00040C689E|nr:class IIc cyclic bacteriocin [Gemella cuniculi]
MNIIEKLTLTKTEYNLIKMIIFLSCVALLFTNVYFIAGKLGITLAPGWYEKLVNYISAGGGAVDGVAMILGITLPGWAITVIGAFGLVSA